MSSPSSPGVRRRGMGRSFASNQDPSAGSAARPTPGERVVNVGRAPRWWSKIGWPVAVLVLGSAAAIAGGVPAWRAIVIALAVAVALWALIVSFGGATPTWYYDLTMGSARIPTPWEVPGLSGSRQSEAWFDEYLRPRLWALAQELLRRRGIDPASDRARELVGARAYDLLTGANTDRRHISSSVSALTHVIARLAVEQRSDSPTPVPRRALSGLAGAPRRRPPKGPHQ